MQVSLKPFCMDIRLEDKCSYHDFLEYLKNQNISCDIVRKQRLLFVDDMNDDYVVGFMLSKRDFSSHCKYKVVDGKIQITLSELEQGMEFNFFMLNKQFLNGVFLTYSHAATIKTLERVLKRGLAQWLSTKDVNITTAFWKKNNITCSPILTQETIDSVLDKLSEITQITFVDVNNHEGLFQPGYLKHTVYKVIFDKKKINKLEQVKKDISDFVRSKKATSISVKGKDNTNVADIINFDCLTRNWKSYDYDQLTKQIVTLDVENLKEHKISQDMLQVIMNNPTYKTIIESR